MTSAIAKRADRFSETEIDGEVVIMQIDNGDFFSLTDSAVEIWKRIDGTRDRDAIVSALAGEFDAPAADIARDVDAFLSQLRDAGLLADG